LEGAKNVKTAEPVQPVVTLQRVQKNDRIDVQIGINDDFLDFSFTNDFSTSLIYFRNGYNDGYCFLTCGIIRSLVETVFDIPVRLSAERTITTANKHLVSVNDVCNKTLIFQDGINSRCYITGSDVYITTDPPPLSSDIDGLITFLGAKGKNIVVTTSAELSVTSEENVVTIAINEDMFNQLNCNAD
jgi:hypothetical protein